LGNKAPKKEILLKIVVVVSCIIFGGIFHFFLGPQFTKPPKLDTVQRNKSPHLYTVGKRFPMHLWTRW